MTTAAIAAWVFRELLGLALRGRGRDLMRLARDLASEAFATARATGLDVDKAAAMLNHLVRKACGSLKLKPADANKVLAEARRELGAAMLADALAQLDAAVDNFKMPDPDPKR